MVSSTPRGLCMSTSKGAEVITTGYRVMLRTIFSDSPGMSELRDMEERDGAIQDTGLGRLPCS